MHPNSFRSPQPKWGTISTQTAYNLPVPCFSAGKQLAREGLRAAIAIRLQNQKVTLVKALAAYRSYLYESGSVRAGNPNGPKAERPRRGFSREEIAEVLAKGGKLELDQALLCRVRYFCAGAVLGSRAFVERVFQSHRDCFGLKRKTAARPLRELNTPGLFVARALRVRPLG